MDLLKVAGYIAKKMKQYQHIIGFFMTLVMLLLRFMPSDNEVLVTRPPAPPSTILSNGSKVFDSWTGSLGLRNLILYNSEIAIVFYYAPWCARSLEAFRELEAAASVMYKQVSFIAINCWWIRGECRGQFQFYEYPKIFLHHRNMRHSILYNGPMKKDNFMYFLYKVMMPMKYLSNKSEVENFLNENQFTVLSAFLSSTLDRSSSFKNYSIIAIKHLENDLLPIQFGVITDQKLAGLYFLKPNLLQVRDKLSPRDMIHLNLKSSIKEILASLNKLRDKLVSPDLHFPETKTNLLYQTVHKGPTLMIFVASDAVKERERYVKKIRQLVMLYKYCEAKEDFTVSRAIYSNTSSARNKCCRSVTFEDSAVSLICSICVKQPSENSKNLYYAVCDFINNFVTNVDDKNVGNWIDMMRQKIAEMTDVTMCADLLSTHNMRSAHLDVCCEAMTTYFQHLEEKKTKKYDDSNIDEILRKKEENSNLITDLNETQITDTSELDHSFIFTDKDHLISKLGDNIITGLRCKTNRTLEFLTLDFDRHKALSDKLGVSSHVYHVGDAKMGAVIFDPVNEKRQVMTSSHFHLENFIINYTLGILPQNRRTSQLPDECSPSSSYTCIHEVTAATFEESVLNNDKDVLLLYYAPWCAACKSITHTYLSLADLLRPVTTVCLAQINAHTNDLPTHLTVQSYPTFILFPAKRSSYSAVFPKDIEISVATLLSFILNNTSWESVKQILSDVCLYGADYPDVQHEACKKWNSVRNEF